MIIAIIASIVSLISLSFALISIYVRIDASFYKKRLEAKKQLLQWQKEFDAECTVL